MVSQRTNVPLLAAVIVLCSIATAHCRVLNSPRGERELSGATGSSGTRSSGTGGLLPLFKSVCIHSETAFINDALTGNTVLDRYKVFGSEKLGIYPKPAAGNNYNLANHF